MNNNKLIKKCIDTLSDIREENILGSDLNNKIDKVINEVKELENHKSIKVAILGEFSAGKSTFINALMRSRVLSYADEPTTAVNTYITYGENELIKIIKNNGKSKIVNKSNIEDYTKESKKISDVKKVIIECDNEYLKNGLTIIDTPGANFESKLHQQRRSDAIDESVVGIFLIGVNSLTSKSFIDFLIENKDKMGKIIFVVNKCDILEEDDINIDFKKADKVKNVYSYVKANIEKYTGNKNIDIHMISSKYFLENKICSIIDVKKSFNKLEERIKEIYIKEKLSLIYWRIFNILKEVNYEINQTLKDKKAIGEYELNKANGEIKSITQFINEELGCLITNVKSELVHWQNRYDREIKLIRDRKVLEFSNRINNINTVKSFESNIKNIYKEEINSYLSDVGDTINHSINEIINKNLSIVEEKYYQYFENLKKVYIDLGIEKKRKIKESFYYIIVIFISFILPDIFGKCLYILDEDLCKYINWGIVPFIVTIISIFILKRNINKSRVIYHVKLDNSIINLSNEEIVIPTESLGGFGIRTSNGLGVGAVIGAFAGGPIGAAIGAGIGGIIGGLFELSELSDLKKEYLEHFNNELENSKEYIDNYIYNVIDNRFNLLIDKYRGYAAENMVLYSELIDGIYEFNTSKINMLINSNNVFGDYLKRINLINKEVVKVTLKLNNK